MATSARNHEILTSSGRQPARHEWRSAYREARKALRFYGDMKDAHGVKVTSMFATLDLCSGFDICRLFGDRLRAPMGHHGRITHENRMVDLRKRVRLPA